MYAGSSCVLKREVTVLRCSRRWLLSTPKICKVSFLCVTDFGLNVPFKEWEQRTTIHGHHEMRYFCSSLTSPPRRWVVQLLTTLTRLSKQNKFTQHLQNIDATHSRMKYLRAMYQLQNKDSLSMCIDVEFLLIWLCVLLVLGSSKLLGDLEYSPQYNERKTVHSAEMT